MEDHAQFDAQARPVGGSQRAGQVQVVEHMSRGCDDRGRFEQPRQGHRRQRLARARLADDSDHLAAGDRQIYVAHALDRAALRCREFDVEPSDLGNAGAFRNDSHRCRLPRDAAAPRRRTRDRGDSVVRHGAKPATRSLRRCFAEHREHKPGEHDRDTGTERRKRIDVDAQVALLQHPAPVVLRRLHTEPEERQPREGQQRHARGGSRVHQERVRDVRKHVSPEVAGGPDADDARSTDEIASGNGRREVVDQAGE